METTEMPRNRVKVAHLVIGLLFLGIVALATGLDTGVLGWSAARYLWPTLLVAAGTIGLGVTYTANRHRVSASERSSAPEHSQDVKKPTD